MASTSNNTPGTSGSSTGNSNNSNNNSSGDSKDNRWYFTAEQLANSPSRRQGIDADQELSFRQLTAYLIQEMGQRLQVSQLCINTAIVYMHRFYAFHSFTHFHRNGIAAAALFLAAKVEEQPRKLEHVIKVAHMCLNQEAPHPSSDLYAEQAQDLVFNENVLLQTLGFDVAIDHPHTHVVKTCHLVKACKDLAQTSYFLASNSLHLTSMCLQYRPTVVACFCIYLACKWSRWEIPQSTEGRHWFHYVDKSVTMDLLKQLTDEFIAIYEKSPARLKSKLNSIKALAQGARIPETSRSIPEPSNNASNSQPVNQVEPTRRPESYSSHHRSHHTSSSHQQVSSHHHHGKLNEVGEHKSSSSHKQPYVPAAAHSNRPRPERSQDPQQYGNLPHGGGGSKQQLPLPPQSTSSRSSSNSGNNSSSNRPQHSIPPLVGSSSTSSSSASSVQRISAHGGHDPNLYHKNRSSIPPQINPSLPSSHKSVSKIQDPIRPPPLMKDPPQSSSLSRSTDPSKLTSKHSNNSVYASQNSGNVGVDMTRNVLQTQQQQSQQQRPYLPQSSSQPANYSQSMLNRTSSSSSRYDQQQQLSVQQPHLSQLQNQKQLNESSFGIINTKSVIDENSKSGGIGGDQMEICSPKISFSQSSIVSSQQQQQQQQYQPQQQYHQISQQQNQQLSSSGGGHQKTSSIFSPEQNERTHSQLQSQQSATLVNTNNPNNNNNNNVTKLGFKSNRDSPKKTERERKSETPKKEKIRPPDMMQMQGAPQMKFTQQQQQMDKRSDIKPLISQDPIPLTSSLSSLPNVVTPIGNFVDFKNQQHLQQQQQQQTHALNFSNAKRRASRDNVIKLNEEILIKDSKIRKTEPQSPPPLTLHNPKSTTIIDQKSQSSLLPSSSSSSSHMFYNMHEQSSINNEKTLMKSYPTILNGSSIETNPDLVSSLLKESLCHESQKYTTPLNVKQEPKENISENCILDTQSIIMETLPEQLLQTDIPIEQQQQLLLLQQKQRNNTDNIKLPMMTNITTTTSSMAAPSEIHPQQQLQQQPQIPIPLTNDEYIKSKSEKKKKKDKHKHKEKDKSKDKEERKKHKKDKDRHKERHHQESVPTTATIEQNPVKIKISKDKLNLSASSAVSTDNMTSSNPTTTTGFKIKIPKDRIKGELTNFQVEDISTKNPSSSSLLSSSSASHHHHQSSTPSSLKIKISKDKIEFNHQQQELSHLTSSSSSVGHHHGSQHHHGTSTSSSSSSNKRKDRDRDRDREKKKSNNNSGDYGKQNGSGSGTKESNNTSSGISSGNFSSSKNQLQTTKIQQYNGNNVSMSQLFGESYDDDEDNSDNYESDYIDSKVNLRRN